MKTQTEKLADALREIRDRDDGSYAHDRSAMRSDDWECADKALAEYGETVGTRGRSDLKTATLSLSEQNKSGFWLWDETRGMNLSMRAASASAAFVEALEYYQKRLAEVEKQHAELNAKVQAFISQFVEDCDCPER